MVRLRKVHPCGGTDWQVYRLGADIGLRCLTCGRRVMLERAVLEKRIKTFVSRANPSPNPLPACGEGAPDEEERLLQTSPSSSPPLRQTERGPGGEVSDV